MALDEAREEVISRIDYAAYKETGFSLNDTDKNRLFGSEHYKSGRPLCKPSPWAEGDFEDKMATLLRMANALNRSVPAFREASDFSKMKNRSWAEWSGERAALKPDGTIWTISSLTGRQ
jgi:hypothetical protein